MISLVSRAAVRSSNAIRCYSTEVAPRKTSSLKGGLFGFLLGTTITGVAGYYYLLNEYKNSSDLVLSDVLALQKSIRNLETQVRVLESKK
ncbi:uncharacterized protein PAS_chr2-1_0858 [Komagataella phaffii GS115]|uniref:Uncharacterized protein n=2 Tax=Komagataella phaffii TaxID=460519 RepID=C4R0Y5_KOMPG|nr:uncharacterized protein PAS_chr2-1_0858 [Komagataella phaffii GS115]CAY69159.1 hypothetical protein PAS_chr2-1_0858 [Komagataella phaffii GS115]